MPQRTRNRRGSDSGFTLVDLFIVTVLAAVCAVVVVFSVRVVGEERTALACRSEKQRIETAVRAYRVLTGNPARSIDQLVSEGFLKDAPSTAPGYTITVNGGAVTASGACS